MRESLRCTRGHHWEIDADAATQELNRPISCPTCGSPGCRYTEDKTIVAFTTKEPVTSLNSVDDLPTLLPGSTPNPSIRSARTLPGYDLFGELGRGGMGVVYKARHQALGRMVAIKMVLSGTFANPEELARFQAEAHAVAKLQHPNIVQIHDIGTHDGQPYFSMEYVNGRSLAQIISSGPMLPNQAARVVETLASAMQYAHEQAIIHRDLKPANILIGQNGTPKITDFGLAKQLDGNKLAPSTQHGNFVGTPQYIAPEQATDSHKVGPATDVYALGVILYEMLTGRRPFDAATAVETVDLVRHQEPVPPNQLQPRIPRDLTTICLKCLRKEPEKRYPTSAELADDLRRFLAKEPIRARPISSTERAWKWARKAPRTRSLARSHCGAACNHHNRGQLRCDHHAQTARQHSDRTDADQGGPGQTKIDSRGYVADIAARKCAVPFEIARVFK